VGQTVVVLGGTSGIGLETARRARAEGANVILTARDPDRLHRIGLELEASFSAFDHNALPLPGVLHSREFTISEGVSQLVKSPLQRLSLVNIFAIGPDWLGVATPRRCECQHDPCDILIGGVCSDTYAPATARVEADPWSGASRMVIGGGRGVTDAGTRLWARRGRQRLFSEIVQGVVAAAGEFAGDRDRGQTRGTPVPACPVVVVISRGPPRAPANNRDRRRSPKPVSYSKPATSDAGEAPLTWHLSCLDGGHR
jgi:hypothetical protein